MSSFVVNKKEYVKAAGLMYGIVASKKHAHRYFLENVRKNFVKCYEMNVDSVAEQYNDDNNKKDSCGYDGIFKTYQMRGADIYSGMSTDITFEELRVGLMKFFDSVLYQIENEEMNASVSSFFYTCTSMLFDVEIYDAEGWWGKVEL